MRKGKFRVIALSMLTMSTVVMSAPSASASCAELADLETAFAEAHVVFIGRVVDLSNKDRTASVEVEQVWKGPELPSQVKVRGGGSLFSQSSVDRTFEHGTYIFFPTNDAPPFEDDICTNTQRTTAALGVINPYAEESEEDGTGGESSSTTIAALENPLTASANDSSSLPRSLPPGWVLGGVGVVILGGMLRRKGRRPNSMESINLDS